MRILPADTGNSQIETNAFPDFPSARVGSQCKAKYAPTSSREGVYVLAQKLDI